MSYRELKNFIDVMSVLGYPRIISIENFRKSNFPLVIEIIVWLFDRFDIELDAGNVLKDEIGQINFWKNVIHSAANKLHLKLNANKLCQSNGQAVQELLKLTSLLYKPDQENEWKDTDDLELNDNNETSAISQMLSKANEFKKIRYIASEITHKGANIFDLLSKESEISVWNISEERNAILNMPIQLNDIGNKLKDVLLQTQKEIEDIHFRMANVSQDEASLDAKIEKQEQELDRYSKRLDQLRSMRPSFQDEYEQLESELIKLYDEYVVKHRCLVYLEEQLDEIERMEQEIIHQKEAQIAEILSKSADADEFNLIDNDDESENANDLHGETTRGKSTKTNRPKSERPMTGRPLTSSKVRVFGSLMDADANDDDSFSDSFNLEDNVRDEDEVDILKGNPKDHSDLDSEEELELLQLTKNVQLNDNSNKTNMRETSLRDRSNIKPQVINQITIPDVQNDSEDDF